MSKEYRDYYAAHVAEMQNRWEAAMDAENLQAVLVHSGTPLISFQDDYEYAFRPNPHFLAWLPLTHHHDSALLLRTGKKPCVFFYQPEDFWYLAPADPESWWADHFDIQRVSQADGWHRGLFSKFNGSFGIRDVAAIGDAPSLSGSFDEERINPPGLVARLQVERSRKTAYEVSCIREASRLATAAHREAERAFRDGESEFRIHLRYLAACEHSDAQLPYNNIIALNSHGSVLHYQGRDRIVPDLLHSFLIDAGCTVNAYASDITRSHAAHPATRDSDVGFAELVSAMDTMQQGLARAVRAGLDYRQLHLQAHREIAVILKSFGIIKVTAEDAVATGLSRVFFPHGLGHFIGLQTHDVAGLIDNRGQPIARPEGHPMLRLTRVLEVGNVLTIEPGLYFIEPLLQQWRAHGDAAAIDWDRVEALKPCGGIRIEDNLLVTAGGSENLTREAFAKL